MGAFWTKLPHMTLPVSRRSAIQGVTRSAPLHPSGCMDRLSYLVSTYENWFQEKLHTSDSNPDTVGESFEQNVAAAQEAGTLIGTARPIILAQGSMPENRIVAISVQLGRAAISRLTPLHSPHVIRQQYPNPKQTLPDSAEYFEVKSITSNRFKAHYETTFYNYLMSSSFPYPNRPHAP
jgi:hypothetical protein